MPYLTVYTNVEMSNATDLAERGARLVADTLGKPIGYVVTNFIYNKAMAFGGQCAEKGALVELKSIGFSHKDKVVEVLTEFLAQQLNIANTHNIDIVLADIPVDYTACGGRTFG